MNKRICLTQTRKASRVFVGIDMTKEEANRILDKVRAGIHVPLYVINQALHATGDL